MNEKGISLVALIITIITIIILSAIIVNANGEISKTKTIAIIKNGNEKLTIEVESYTRGYGDVLIRAKDGRTYITSDFLIIKE